MVPAARRQRNAASPLGTAALSASASASAASGNGDGDRDVDSVDRSSVKVSLNLGALLCAPMVRLAEYQLMLQKMRGLLDPASPLHAADHESVVNALAIVRDVVAALAQQKQRATLAQVESQVRSTRPCDTLSCCAFM
jgi:hypothetical protein